jgi:hypothetical protein
MAPPWTLPLIEPPEWLSAAPAAPPPPSPLGSVSQPKTPADAPASISVPADVNKQFDKLWADSFPGNPPKSQEHGGILVKDASGNLTLANAQSGNQGDFPVNRTLASGQQMVGVFHTHPYDASEGGMTDVSLSGGDLAYAINNGDSVIVAQSGDGQFMVLRTDQTPAQVDYDKLNDGVNDRIAELQKSGMGFSEASQQAAKEAAVANHMAYYEGKGGEFKRVSP